MKAITLWQPWASLLVAGADRPKTIETRPWRTEYRGRLLIHAAKQEPRWVRDAFFERSPLRDILRRHVANAAIGFVELPALWKELPRGAVVGGVRLVDCVPTDDPALDLTPDEELLGDYAPGRWAWITRMPYALPSPIRTRGHQRLWDPPERVVAYLRRQAKESPRG